MAQEDGFPAVAAEEFGQNGVRRLEWINGLRLRVRDREPLINNALWFRRDSTLNISHPEYDTSSPLVNGELICNFIENKTRYLN